MAWAEILDESSLTVWDIFAGCADWTTTSPETGPFQPTNPTNLSGGYSGSHPQVAWVASTDPPGVTFTYKVHRQRLPSPGTWSTIATSITGTAYTDNSKTAPFGAYTYDYKVSTYTSGGGDSPGYTNIVSFQSPPPVPANFTLTLQPIGNTWRPKLTWSQVTSTGLAGYKIERKINGGGWSTPYWGTLGPGATSVIDYEVIVWASSNFETATYRMRSYDGANVNSSWTGTVSVDFHIMFKRAPAAANLKLPDHFTLGSAFPNPFNPSTTIRYALPEASSISLAIYDLAGREVRRWQLTEEAGHRSVTWNATDQAGHSVPAGVYIYRLVAAGNQTGQRFSQTRKMVLLK